MTIYKGGHPVTLILTGLTGQQINVSPHLVSAPVTPKAALRSKIVAEFLVRGFSTLLNVV